MTSFVSVTSFVMLLLALGVSGDLQGVGFLGVGYNLLEGNPDGIATSNLGGIDPGLKPTRKIFHITPGDSPPEVISVHRDSCVSEAAVYYGTQSYHDTLMSNVQTKAGASVGTALVKFAFSFSKRYSNTYDETNLNRQVFWENQTVCNMGRLRYEDELHYPVSPNFAAAVCDLPAKYNEAAYMNFIDTWGTHVTTIVDYGTKNVQRFRSTLTEFVEHVRKDSGTGVSVGGSYMGFGASLSVDFSKYKGSDSYNSGFGSYKYTLVAGSANTPEPISLEIATLDLALNSKYWQDKSLCSNVDLQKSLTSWKNNIINALQHYPTFKGATAPTNPQLRIPITWPKGTYGLLKPTSGCPGDKTQWHEGTRYEDLENTHNENYVPSVLHMDGAFHAMNDFLFYFCMKDDETFSKFDMDWPAGDYCIYKYGACPTGFKEGWIFFDDENTNHRNFGSNPRPDGEYGKDTKIFYCCRSDAHATRTMYLPTAKPFYLIQHSQQGCQMVHDMDTSTETLGYDTQGNKPLDHGGMVPVIRKHGNVPTLNYCYYQRRGHGSIVG